MQHNLPFWRVEGNQIDASIAECLIGWCEEREGSSSLEGGQQICLNHSVHERVVNACSCCVRWNVLGLVSAGVEGQGGGKKKGEHNVGDCCSHIPKINRYWL